MNLKSCFGYIRVSSLGQGAEDKDGLVRQREAIKKFAAAHGLRIVRWFEDKISGKTDLENRPALGALRTALNEDGVKLVLIEKLDRLARDLMVQEAIVADFKQHGFTLMSALEPDLLSDDPSRVLIRQILGAFSQYERAMIVLKLQGAKQRIRAKNPAYKEGRKPYGYRPGEAKTITRVKELHAAGHNLSSIAQQITTEGHKTRTGAPRWFATQVRRILRTA
jgi:DNA invertase Pin-like site-specific DNA recombinase